MKLTTVIHQVSKSCCFSFINSQFCKGTFYIFSFEPFALALRRNDSDFRLLADRVISDLYRSKEILNIYDKWFGKFSQRRTPAFEALIELNATPE